jgi:hypothetical protein
LLNFSFKIFVQMATADNVVVLPGANFSSFQLDDSATGEPRIQFLAKIESNGHFSGDWRVALSGPLQLSYVFSGSQIYQSSQLAGKKNFLKEDIL